ncbi:MAG: hypothetical protein WCJ33_05315, partial [Pseudomonadota bacterium]
MEFGIYFLRSEITNRAISTISQTVQRNPNFYSSLTPTQQQELLRSYGSGLIDFNQAGNNICVDSYLTQAEAANPTNPCTATHIDTVNPNGLGSIPLRLDNPKIVSVYDSE